MPSLLTPVALGLLLLSLPFSHSALPSTDTAMGYWGPMTASEDWCEKNYVVTPYIAEFWNTISNLPIIFAALVALYLGVTRGYAWHLMIPSLCMLFVGIGSTIFHGTLSYSGQAMDELSMVLCATAFLYVNLEADARKRLYPVWVGPALLAWSASFIAAYFFLKESNFFLFFVVIFVVLSLGCCRGAYMLHLRTAHPTLKSLFFLGQVVWASAFIVFWLPDKLLCPYVQHLHLHAIFHFLTAVAVSWYNTHNVHCYYSALYASRTGSMGDGTTIPAPLLEFISVKDGEVLKVVGTPLLKPSLVYLFGTSGGGSIGPFVDLVVDESGGAKAK